MFPVGVPVCRKACEAGAQRLENRRICLNISGNSRCSLFVGSDWRMQIALLLPQAMGRIAWRSDVVSV